MNSSTLRIRGTDQRNNSDQKRIIKGHWSDWAILVACYVGGSKGLRSGGEGGGWHLERFLWGGMADMPCLESSANTISVEGGLRPKGIGSHGLLIASFTALSTTSSACIHPQPKENVKLIEKFHAW